MIAEYPKIGQVGWELVVNSSIDVEAVSGMLMDKKDGGIYVWHRKDGVVLTRRGCKEMHPTKADAIHNALVGAMNNPVRHLLEDARLVKNLFDLYLAWGVEEHELGTEWYMIWEHQNRG